MHESEVRSAPNYTTACVAMFGVNLAWILIAIWSIWGLIIAVMFCGALNHAMTRIQAWAIARHAASLRRGKPFHPRR